MLHQFAGIISIYSAKRIFKKDGKNEVNLVLWCLFLFRAVQNLLLPENIDFIYHKNVYSFMHAVNCTTFPEQLKSQGHLQTVLDTRAAKTIKSIEKPHRSNES